MKRVRGQGSPDGEVSRHLHEHTRVGDLLRVSVPYGDLVLDDLEAPLLLASAGIGCTPVVAMLDHLAQEDHKGPVTVVHGDRSPADHALRADHVRLAERLPDAEAHFWYEAPEDRPPGKPHRPRRPGRHHRAAGQTTSATAAAGRLLGFTTVGVVRGDELAHRPLNPSLARCAADGMRLHFVDRTTYRAKTSPEVLEGLLGRFGDVVVVPEGGSNALAAQGCTALGRELADEADVAAVACGTGGTLAGLAAGLAAGQRALGVPVVGGPAPGGGRGAAPARGVRRPAPGTGRWTSASPSAATPVRPRNWTPSPRTSRTGTGCRWSGSTSPSCCSR
ncbi:Flavohemoprotein [Streptomyces californicus]